MTYSNSKKGLLVIFSFLSLLLLQNCTKGEAEYDLKEKSDSSLMVLQEGPVVDKLVEMGYLLERIQEYDDFYLVQGDLMFSKDLDDYGKQPDAAGRHAHTNNLVTDLNVATITVFIDASIPSTGTDNWRNAISSAINDWNVISNCNVRFSRISNANADITIESDNGVLANNVIAAAGFPAGGQPHNSIIINLDFNSNANISEGSKRYNMVHEFGHTIGFRHTNWELVDPATNVGANLIPLTPTQDSNSVMNGGTANNSWSGFSTYDKVAARFVYPKPLSMSPGYVSLNSMNPGQTMSISGVGPVKVTLSGDSGVYLDSGNGFRTTLNLTAPTTFAVYAPQIGPGYGSRLSTVWLRRTNNTVIDHSDVNHSY